MLRQGVEKLGREAQSPPASYEKLEAEADQCRRKMDRIKRVMSDKFTFVHDSFVTSHITVETIPHLIQELRDYVETADQETAWSDFSQSDIYDFIEYLKAKQKHDDLCRQMRDQEKAELGIAEKVGTIAEKAEEEKETSQNKPPIYQEKYPKARLCDCGRHERKEEHNRRCFYILDTKHNIGIHLTNPNINTPDKLLKAISRSGSERGTSAEEKNLIVEYLKAHGTIAQKVMINNYFYYRLFPVPFPECETHLFGNLLPEI